MKKFITALALVAGATFGYSQECTVQDEPNYNGDEAGCRQGISLYTEFLKQENFKDAAKEWWTAQKTCPQYKPLMYDNGAYIYKQLAKAETDKSSANYKNMMDTLNLVYDLWVENFGDCYEIQMRRAHDNMMDETKRYDKAYRFYTLAFENTPEDLLQSYDAVYFFRSAYFMVSGKLIDCGVMMEQYEMLDRLCKDKIKKAQDAGDSGEVQNWLTTQQTIESYVAPCASADVLIQIYKPQTDDDPENLELAKSVLKKLDKVKAEDSDYYIELITRVDAAEPSPETKLMLGNVAYKNKEYSKALGYYDAAVAYETVDEETKAKLYQKMGEINLSKGSYKQAFKYGGLLGGCEGKYIQAKAVAASATSCAETRTQRTAVYSYALDLADAAGSCASSSWKQNLQGQLSTKTDLFSEGLKEGSSYEVPCWGLKVKLRIQ